MGLISLPLLRPLADTSTVTIFFSEVSQLVSHQEPKVRTPRRRCLEMGGTTRSFPSCFPLGRGTSSRCLNVSTGLKMATARGLSNRHQKIGDLTSLPVLAGDAALCCLRGSSQSTLNPFQDTGNLSHPSITHSLSTEDHPCTAGQKLLSPKPAKFKVQSEKNPKPKKNPTASR